MDRINNQIDSMNLNRYYLCIEKNIKKLFYNKFKLGTCMT